MMKGNKRITHKNSHISSVFRAFLSIENMSQFLIFESFSNLGLDSGIT